MNNKDFVPFETAKKLKAAGFDEPCSVRWECEPDDVPSLCSSVFSFKNKELEGLDFTAPTLWQAAKWLREECGLHVDVGPYSDYSKDADGEVCDRWDFWGFDIYEVTGGKRLTDDDGEYDSYEAALSAGIDAALDLITNKKIVK